MDQLLCFQFFIRSGLMIAQTGRVKVTGLVLDARTALGERSDIGGDS